MSLAYCIDEFCASHEGIRVRGWAFDSEVEIVGLTLRWPSGELHPIASMKQPSPDVQAAHGDRAANCRFDEICRAPPGVANLAGAEIIVNTGGGDAVLVHLEALSADPGHALISQFFQALHDTPPGRLLEIGSRARSGHTRRSLLPPEWSYVGLDVMNGPNVDIVGDAHELSDLFEPNSLDAAMAFSTLEHLLMPWKFVVELNRILKPGAIGLFTTHQTWPLHDAPWDFFRFSDTAWTGLLNRATGFEIVAARMGEPCRVVANKLHAAVDFDVGSVGYLISVVLFRKVAETALRWPVAVSDITQTAYPEGEIAAP